MISKIIKMLFLIIIIIILFSVFRQNRENYLCFKSDGADICKNFVCTNGSCVDNPIESYGHIIDDSLDCFGNEENTNFEDCKFNKIVNPYNPKCVDFCVNTYTNPENTRDKISGAVVDGEFRGKRFNHAFFTSKCGQCIDNFYNTIKKITDTENQEIKCGVLDPLKS